MQFSLTGSGTPEQVLASLKEQAGQLQKNAGSDKAAAACTAGVVKNLSKYLGLQAADSQCSLSASVYVGVTAAVAAPPYVPPGVGG